ncbi:hypothetical protein Vadar_014358 [Vaccinium darrowii]|uniref:Uncharacterized protein n=1 Tax=Vaccinium darrowii TaxID=229202 RepID=A0ACB7XHW8_9ERIC|nr:hypothetical protein Vadar_014358 [Vaccinium darrowii]
MVVEKSSKCRRQNSDSESSGGDDSRAKQVSKRTHEEVIGDHCRKWLAAFPRKKGKNERQVDEADLGKDIGVKEIYQEGLQKWFEPLSGFNRKCVKELYTTMKAEKEGDEPMKIKAKVVGKLIQVTPDHIAEHLKYTRPNPETINYPREKPLDKQIIKDFLYEDPTGELEPINPSQFQDDIRILNKVIHANLYPKGKANAPTSKSLELMASFVDVDTKVDWAYFNFLQMVDYLDTPVGPTMLCSTLEKSKAQRKNNKPKVSKAAPSSTPVVSTSTVPPPPSEPKSNSPALPPEGSEVTKWYKRFSKQLATVLKNQRKAEKENKLAKHQREWQTKVLEGLSGQRYEVPPEVEEEDSDDEEGDEDESDGEV